jgi:hypothetical protein
LARIPEVQRIKASVAYQPLPTRDSYENRISASGVAERMARGRGKVAKGVSCDASS